MKVKVCGMTNSQNLSKVLEARPDYIGMIFYARSPRSVLSQEMILETPQQVKRVGVFVNEQLDKVIRIAEEHALDYLQLHGEESPEYCEKLQAKGKKIIKACSISMSYDFKQLEPYCKFVEYFLFDTKGEYRGGNGVKFDWKLLDNYSLNTPFILSGGITPQDTELIQSIVHPQCHAIDINSGFETEIGIKDPRKVRNFIEKLKNSS